MDQPSLRFSSGRQMHQNGIGIKGDETKCFKNHIFWQKTHILYAYHLCIFHVIQTSTCVVMPSMPSTCLVISYITSTCSEMCSMPSPCVVMSPVHWQKLCSDTYMRIACVLMHYMPNTCEVMKCVHNTSLMMYYKLSPCILHKHARHG